MEPRKSLRWVHKGSTEVQIREALVTSPNSSEGTELLPITSGLKAADLALSDPLRAETRKARLYLLGVSMVGIAIAVTGLVPKEITTLGITFEQSDRQSLLSILALVTLYFLVTFVTYGISDYLYWQQAYRNSRLSEIRQTVLDAEKAVAAHMSALEQAGDDEAQREIREIREIIRVVDKTVLDWHKPDQRLIIWYPALSSVVSPVRAVVEFVLPLLVGLCAIYILVVPTALQAIVAGVVAGVVTLVMVRAVRRSRDAPVRDTEVTTQAATEAPTRAATGAAVKAAAEAAAEVETPKEPPQDQPRDR
jgi:hypothetical protein